MEDESVCWICLEGASAERGQLARPCNCPRDVHLKCLSRWCLQQAGRSEERLCRFCKASLPDWKTVLTGPAPACDPIMVVTLGSVVHKIRVKPGEEGRRQFQQEIRRLFNIPAGVDFEVTFRCKAPCTAETIQLEGMSSYHAATHCASLMAAQRLAAASNTTSSGAATASNSAPGTDAAEAGAASGAGAASAATAAAAAMAAPSDGSSLPVASRRQQSVSSDSSSQGSGSLTVSHTSSGTSQGTPLSTGTATPIAAPAPASAAAAAAAPASPSGSTPTSTLRRLGTGIRRALSAFQGSPHAAAEASSPTRSGSPPAPACPPVPEAVASPETAAVVARGGLAAAPKAPSPAAAFAGRLTSCLCDGIRTESGNMDCDDTVEPLLMPPGAGHDRRARTTRVRRSKRLGGLAVAPVQPHTAAGGGVITRTWSSGISSTSSSTSSIATSPFVPMPLFAAGHGSSRLGHGHARPGMESLQSSGSLTGLQSLPTDGSINSSGLGSAGNSSAMDMSMEAAQAGMGMTLDHRRAAAQQHFLASSTGSAMMLLDEEQHGARPAGALVEQRAPGLLHRHQAAAAGTAKDAPMFLMGAGLRRSPRNHRLGTWVHQN